MYSIICDEKWVKYRVLVGVLFLNLPGGFSIFYGNLYAYTESYYRARLSPDRTDLNPAWVLSICLTVLPIGSLAADAVKFRIGLRFSVLVGVFLYCSGFLLTYLTVKNSVWATSLTFGVVGMFGLGVVEVLSFCFTSTWFPQRQGLAGSMVTAGSSTGAILYNSVITAYINPRNLKPDLINGDMAYFTQPEILDRVPMVFIVLGIVTAVAQITGYLMIKSPDFDASEAEEILKKSSDKDKRIRKLSYNSSSKSSLSSMSDDLSSNGAEGNPKTMEDSDSKSDSDSGKYKNISADYDMDMCPRDVLKSTTFYLLWFSLMALSLGMLVVSTYYKFFAQVWIPDDAFLTIVGNVSAFSCTLFRIVMGFLIDRFRIKSVMIGTLSTTCLCLSFWYYTAKINRWLYFLCTNLLAGLTGAVFIIYPLASMKFFGLTYFATNTGLVMLAMTVVDVASAPIISFILIKLGWFWLFFTVSAFTAASLLATAFLMTRKQLFCNR